MFAPVDCKVECPFKASFGEKSLAVGEQPRRHMAIDVEDVVGDTSDYWFLRGNDQRMEYFTIEIQRNRLMGNNLDVLCLSDLRPVRKVIRLCTRKVERSGIQTGNANERLAGSVGILQS